MIWGSTFDITLVMPALGWLFRHVGSEAKPFTLILTKLVKAACDLSTSMVVAGWVVAGLLLNAGRRCCVWGRIWWDPAGHAAAGRSRNTGVDVNNYRPHVVRAGLHMSSSAFWCNNVPAYLPSLTACLFSEMPLRMWLVTWSAKQPACWCWGNTLEMSSISSADYLKS
jgi:hypothetical protein